MGALFDGLQRLLGETLAFFFGINGGSFGLAIVMLTIVINIVLFPLTLRQTRATRAFQEIQPEIKRIQKEFKEDSQKMQQELMRVQREAGATPGGCIVPLLVQAPIWFALFRVLTAISNFSNGQDVVPPVPETSTLYEALQVHDISFLGMDLGATMSTGILAGVPAAIAYVLMLMLMVASQYFQQWHAQRGNTPRTDLTAQQRQQQQTQQVITRVMPLFIGFISWNFPAGLVVYWTTSNVFRLGQQFAIFAIDGRPPQPGDNGGSAPKGSGPPDGSDSGGDSETAAEKKPQPRSAKKRRRRR
ncbi:MAG TPA: YidC/Oxa1 family membrane protein insertase [Acidimicrobiia bacterium]|nr:YidC/Oxa1 family membrane protein insertase [Acidimicrobiia bacterium]